MDHLLNGVQEVAATRLNALMDILFSYLIKLGVGGLVACSVNLMLNFHLLCNTGEGTGLLRLHSTYRHDLKIYSSDEGRVQVSSLLLLK